MTARLGKTLQQILLGKRVILYFSHKVPAMSYDTNLAKKTTKRKDDSLAELTRVVSELKELSSVQGKIIGQIVETLSNKEKEKPARFVHDIPFGEVFHRVGKQGSYIRVKPTSYLLNSSLVSEALSRGRSLVCHLDSSTVFFIEDEAV